MDESKVGFRDRFDCDLLCRAAGLLDFVAQGHAAGPARDEIRLMADQVFDAAKLLRYEGRDVSDAPQKPR